MSKIIRLPGLVDTHVHLREPGATQKEDFSTGTKAAIAGGYTIVLDMPNNPIATITPETLQQKKDLAKGRIYADVGFHFGASPKSIQYFDQVKDKVFGLKVYMNPTTGDLLMENDSVLEEVFKNWPKDKPLMVHAEGDTLQKAIGLAKKFGNKLHVCHMSLAQEVELIKQARKDGLKISCEVTAHHLFLTEQDVNRLGSFGMMRPPLASEADQDALWQAISEGVVDIIASDHAPHTKEEKLNSEKVINGVPGLETTLLLMLTAVNDQKLTIERLIDLTSANPRRIFKLEEQPETFVEVDLEEKYTITDKNLQTKCGWTPFAGMEVTGKIKKVVLRGEVVFDGQNISGPYGQITQPSK